jgi:D-tyrosyl-tRNA(Tyr) deacylase
MRAVLQRVSRAAVMVNGQSLGAIGPGLVVLVGVGTDDAEADAAYICEKVLHLRLFPDGERSMERSALEAGADLLVISQFTLYASTRRGRRPAFTEAAPPADAAPRFDDVLTRLRASGLRVETGLFGAMMAVDLVNDGPVTIVLDSADRLTPRR